MLLKSLKASVVFAAVLMLYPAIASAQSAIAGQVRDNTGAVLPGTVVEASSPALIEGRRTAVTDGQGQYSIVDLRPGLYSVTFSLDGFSRVVRDGVQLPSNFTATLDITLSVSALQETVTVSGASPIVDVTQTQRSTVFNRELMNAIPTSNNMWAFAQLAPGVTMNGTDVAGTSNGSDRELSAHGLSSTHTIMSVDGMNVNTTRADGRAALYFQDLGNEEVVLDTAGGSADMSSGGLRVNMIPRDGGNRRSGTLFLGGTPGSWQADNFTQRLKDTGMRSVDAIERIFDYGGTTGGPIIQNRLWYNVSVRYWGTYDLPADSFLDDGSAARRDGDRYGLIPRLTLQATSRDKLSLHVERVAQFRGPRYQAKYPAIVNGLGPDPETAGRWRDPKLADYLVLGKWTSTVTNRLLLEVSGGRNFTNSSFLNMPGVQAAVGTPEWYAHTAKNDADLGTFWDAAQTIPPIDGAWKQMLAGAVSYVTGTHNMKAGVQYASGKDQREQIYNGHISTVTYRSGVPSTVTVNNSPAPTEERLRYDVGLYAQDRWSFNRLSINGGLRLEWLNSGADAQDVGAGRFVPARHFDAVNDAPDFFNLSPRVGIAYDLFGNAKTALKFSAGKYSTPLTTSLARQLNPLAITTQAIPWSDPNRDGIVQDSELDLTRLPSNFGTRQVARLDPDLKRETNTELMLGVQHELMPRLAVFANWFRRSYADKRVIDDLNRGFSDYREVQVVSPYNGELMKVYDLTSAAVLSRPVDQVIRNAGFTEVYNGFEWGADLRIPGGGRLFANMGTQRIIANDCDQPDDPNQLRFCDRGNLPAPYNAVPFLTDFKLAGSLPLPLGFSVSGVFISKGDKGKFQNLGYGLAPEYLITRTTTYTAAQCAGRPCTAGAPVIPNMVLPSITTLTGVALGGTARNFPLAPSGTEIILPRLNQLDLGVKKTFRAGGVSLEPRFDVFNVFNVDTEVAYRSVTYGTPAYLLPGSLSNLAGESGVIVARMPRLSLQVRW
jgi:Carboxypeptidase regulatory-like domain/TonB-dependent Receptor Plug Domain